MYDIGFSLWEILFRNLKISCTEATQSESRECAVASRILVPYPAPTDSWLVSESLVTEIYRPFHPAETPPSQEQGWSLLCSSDECRSCHTTQRSCKLDPMQSYKLVWDFVCSGVSSWVSPSWYPPCLLPWGTLITGYESLARVCRMMNECAGYVWCDGYPSGLYSWM